MSSDDPEKGTSDKAATPEDPFALVGNEIRAEIVRTFGDVHAREQSRPVLTFSELRSQADIDIDSSKFNYHLQKLVGHFLEKIETGYQLRPEGYLLYKTLVAGTFDRRSSHTTVDVGMDCHYCTTAVGATFNNGLARIQCPGCDYLYDIATVPPGVVDGEVVELSQISQYNHHKHLAFARGVCPTCGDALDTEFHSPAEVPFPGGERHEVYIYRSCDHCGAQRYLSVGEALLIDQELLSFCHEHGVNVFSTPLWELEFAATDRGVTTRSTDPWEVALEVSYGGDTLELVVAEDLSVSERNRV